MIKKIGFVIFLVLGLAHFALAQAKIPTLSGPVIDQVGLVSRSDERYLESLLRDYNNKGKAQLQVLVIDSLDGEPIETFSIRVVEKWKLGSSQADNGILFIIAVSDRRMRIEVGQGLEGALPDVIAKRIIEDLVTPLFRAQRYSDGVVAGVSEIIHQVDAEYAAGNLKETPRAAKKKPGLAMLIFLALIFISIGRLRPSLLNRGGSPYHGGRWGTGGGHYGGFGGGGGGWSGGGGGFSGGGASGGW